MVKGGKKKKNKQEEMGADGYKLVASNRTARFKYEILETLQAGIVLVGSEVKSLRAGKCNLTDSYATPIRSELYLMNCHISPYDPANIMNHEPMRQRKLLLHRREINRLLGRITEKGLTVVPLKVYFINGRVKVDLGLARGKRLHDKRETIKRRDLDREAAREMSNRR